MIQLTPEQQQFIDDQVAQGSFASADDAVKAAVDLLREQAKQHELDAVVESANRGMEEYKTGGGRPMDDVFDEIHERLGIEK